ncbi:MAG: carboxypeptidase regulatory-like domain-containing protein [Acidobacteria bacterium]|nr:carboxypeptidase regulatory-like domain-containing protein [Acidobacteriota bacterium]
MTIIPTLLQRNLKLLLAVTLSLLMMLTPLASVSAATSTTATNPGQDPVTGAFEGTVSSSQGGAAIAGAVVQFVNTVTEVPVAKRSDTQGRFYQGLLQPGVYRIRVSATGFKTKVIEQRLLATRGNTVVPLPVTLDPDVVAAQPTQPNQPNQPAQPPPPVTPAPPTPVVSLPESAELNVTDGRRGGAYTDAEIATLPLGDTTFTRTVDSFALLIPGLALPPQTGRVAGPGVGAGVGSAGQFSANGLRSRANNFLVDGSDNNDEDIGVRRQGFFMLAPQPVESIKEYQVISNLAPAQFGRNIGAQVNAISKSGGYETHGAVFGLLNTSALNARDYFDTTSSGQPTPLQGLNFSNGGAGVLRNVFICPPSGTNCAQKFVRNPAAGQDSLTFGQAGLVLGGPLLPRPKTDATGATVGSTKNAFYFLSLEGSLLNANKEQSFAVPTVEERGFARSGGTGLDDGTSFGFPTSNQGDAVFSLYPFPNNNGGVYGRNTYTQILPASAQGYIASFKMDHSRKIWGRDQSFTGRYNRTHDWRNIPATGDALFATLRPKVGTQNFSFFWNSELTHEGATTPFFNQFRASYGRTRLNFEEERDVDHLAPSAILPNTPFTLNAPYLANFTVPTDQRIEYLLYPNRTTELGLLSTPGCNPNSNATPVFGQICSGALGPIGQILMPGFSPLGVDVYNFPQRRVNNTFQLADILSFRKGEHSAALGADIRRSQLNSDLQRNALPQLVFGGAPVLNFTTARGFFLDGFFRPDSLAASQAASGFFQSLATIDTSVIGLRSTQYNFFIQDEWRVKPNFSLSVGMRYEYNTVPNEVNSIIEKTFNSTKLDLPSVAGLKQFLAGRGDIYDSDRNNFGPRAGFAYGKNWGLNKQMVIRGGYGLFYDQIIGAVTSQSRNVFPNYLTVNTGGGLPGAKIPGTNVSFTDFQLFNPALSLPGANFSNGLCLQVVQNGCAPGRFFPYVVLGTPNRLNPNLPLDNVVSVYNREFPGGFGFTLPSRALKTPLAHHYSLTLEQQLARNLTASVGYVGTQGRNLLRLTTPNLGPNLNMISSSAFYQINPDTGSPIISGIVLAPGVNIDKNLNFVGGRPIPNAGTIYLYQTTARSRYDSLQAQLRGTLRNQFNFQIGYVWSHALDDASDVFDLAGAPALPQNSLRPSEYASANFDTRHRLTYNFLWTLPALANAHAVKRAVLGGFEIAGTGQYQTGQPFTVNSINDINLDGNYTDRLHSTRGLVVNDDRRVRLSFANNATFSEFWGTIGTDGVVGRNTFRASNYLLLDLALVKNFAFTERQRLLFRVDAFNFTDRANFAIPVRNLEAASFGSAVDTVTPGRRVQFALKYLF